MRAEFKEKLHLVQIDELGNMPRRYTNYTGDCFVTAAHWLDTDQDLNDEELDLLNDLGSDLIYDEVMKRMY